MGPGLCPDLTSTSWSGALIFPPLPRIQLPDLAASRHRSYRGTMPNFCIRVTMSHRRVGALPVQCSGGPRFATFVRRPGRRSNSAEAVMNEKLRTGFSGYEWRWWHNVFGLAVVLGIVVLMSW